MHEITPTEPSRNRPAESRSRCALVAAGATHPGEVRETNEDAFRVEATIGLVVVADGVAGTKGGGTAALTVVNAVCEALLERARAEPVSSPLPLPVRTAALTTALVEAHHRVRNTAVHTGQPNMATTVVALWCVDGHAIVMHAGDSRAYRLRSGTLEQVTGDHTLAAEYVGRNGSIPPELDRSYRHILTRSVSAGTSRFTPEGRAFPLLPGDTFVVCTDGLTGGVPDETIAFIAGSESERDAAETLIALACDAGGGDNITVVVARFR